MTKTAETARILDIRTTADRVLYRVGVVGRTEEIQGPPLSDLLPLVELSDAARKAPSEPAAERRFLEDLAAAAGLDSLYSKLQAGQPYSTHFLFVSAEGALGRLPWEAVPSLLALPDTLVVRVPSPEGAPSSPAGGPSPAGAPSKPADPSQKADEPPRDARTLGVAPLPRAGERAHRGGEMSEVVRYEADERGERGGRDIAFSGPKATSHAQRDRLLILSAPRALGRVSRHLAAEAGDLAREAASNGRAVTTLAEPSKREVLSALEEKPYRWLHVSLAQIDRDSDTARIHLREDRDDPESFLTMAELSAAAQRAGVETVLVTGHDSLSLCETFCRAGARSAVGWLGFADEEQMRRFSMFFYRRLWEGASGAAAVQLYYETALRRGADRLSGTPGAWMSAPQVLSIQRDIGDRAKPNLEGYRADGDTARGHEDGRSIGLSGGWDAVPDVRIEAPASASLNPALIKNGRPAIDRLLITSSGARSKARLQITCDTGISTSTYARHIRLLPGPQEVMMEDAHFPCLYELLAREGGRRHVSFLVTLSDVATGKLLAETTFALLTMAGREWLDNPGTWAYLPAFVLPYAKGTRDVVAASRETLRILKNETADFMAHYEDDPNDIDTQARAIFKTLQSKYGIRYMPPPGLGVYETGQRAGQFIRLPEDILEHRWGTCHDLSLFFAGSLEHIGIRPLILMSKSHTFTGYWRDLRAYADYWRGRAAAAGASAPTVEDWLIRASTDIDSLVQRRAIALVEATYFAGPTHTFEAALAKHVDNTDPKAPRFAAHSFEVAVDVRKSRSHVQPL